jgi:hypothetical protein
MNIKLARKCVTVFVLICVNILVSINLIPRGNFISAPVITLFNYVPLIIVQVVLLIQIWAVEKAEKRAMNLIFYSSLLITLIFIYLFYHFLRTTS